MELVCITKAACITKGRTYEFRGCSRKHGTVLIKDDNGVLKSYKLDEEVIFLSNKKALRNTEDYTDMLMSLAEAVGEAGGDPDKFIHQVNRMSVHELMDSLAPNGVRFVCNKVVTAGEAPYPFPGIS